MEKYTFCAVSRTLTITAKFAYMMNDPESDESQLVAKFQTNFPDLHITKRTQKAPTRYNTKSGETYKHNQFKDLTYDRMEKFIAVLPQDKTYRTEYEMVKAFACAAKHNGYPIVRKWFVEQFPHFRKDPIFYLNNSPLVLHGQKFIEALPAEDKDDVA